MSVVMQGVVVVFAAFLAGCGATGAYYVMGAEAVAFFGVAFMVALVVGSWFAVMAHDESKREVGQ